MKFGKYIQSVASEWATPQYLNYKALKKIIGSVPDYATIVGGNSKISSSTTANISGKDPVDPVTGVPIFTTLAAVNPPGVASALEQTEEYKAAKTSFFFNLERELEKVNTFYLQKEGELKIRLLSLVEKKRLLMSNKKRTLAALSSLKESFFRFQNDLAKLQRFAEINATGFRKILKKWDKRAKSTTKEIYLARQIEIQPCFNKDILAELTDMATNHISEIEKELESYTQEIDGTTMIKDSLSSPYTDDLELELAKYLREKDAAALGLLLDQRKKIGPSSKEDKEVISKLMEQFCVDTSIECLRLLISTGDVDFHITSDLNDLSALHEAAIAGRLDVLQLCIENHAPIEEIDLYGRTPLHCAAMYGHAECLVFLLSQPTITVDPVDHEGFTPFVYAVMGGFSKCCDILIRHGAQVEPISDRSPIPLSIACQNGFTDIVTSLLDRGVSKKIDRDGLNPLHLAVRQGHGEIAQILIRHGAEVEAKDSFNGWTPLFFAASEGHLDCIRVLLEAGATVYIKDESGWLPWTYALYRGHMKAAKLLEVTFPPSIQQQSGAVTSSNNSGGVVAMDQDVSDLKPMAPSGLFWNLKDGNEKTNNDDKKSELKDSFPPELDDIPSLSLPPPIIPFRIYGHNYLDGKLQIQIHFCGFEKNEKVSPIRMFGSRQLSTLRLVVSSKQLDEEMNHTIMIPLKDESEVYSFLTGDFQKFSLQFDLYPMYGSKLIARGVVLSSQLSNLITKKATGAGESEPFIIPLLNSHLSVAGQLSFHVSIVTPFIHPRLRIGGGVETYWKSTQIVKSGAGTAGTHHHSAGHDAIGTGIQSLVTASSLAEEYILCVVQLTKDGVPVVFADWHIPLEDLKLGVQNVTLAQIKGILGRGMQKDAAGITGMGASVNAAYRLAKDGETKRLSSVEMAERIYDSLLTLEEVFKTLPPTIGVCLMLKYPTDFERKSLDLTDTVEINQYVDAVLRSVYNHAAQRSIIFASFNPAICTAINWKQPNYGVFFGSRCGFDAGNGIGAETDARCQSIKEAIKFAKSSNLLGLICEAGPLIQMPVLINTIKESGLILATTGTMNSDPANVALQEKHGVDAIISRRVFKYKEIIMFSN